MSVFVRRLATKPNPKQNTLKQFPEIHLDEMNVGYDIQQVCDWFGLSAQDIQTRIDIDGVNVYGCYTGHKSIYIKHKTVHQLMREFDPSLLDLINKCYSKNHS